VPNLGMGELLIILVIVLLIFGASRLPQIGEGLGKAIRGLKRGLNTDDDIEVTPKDKQVEGECSAEKVPRDGGKKDVSEAEIVEKKSG